MADYESIQAILNQVAIQAATAVGIVLGEANVGPNQVIAQPDSRRCTDKGRADQP